MSEYTREYVHEGIVCRYVIEANQKISWHIPEHRLYFSSKNFDEGVKKIEPLVKISIEANESK
jgi:hypothetical protein